MSTSEKYDPQSGDHANKLDWWLDRKDMSNREFARRLTKALKRPKPISDAAVSRWRSGDRTPRDPKTLAGIAKVTNNAVKTNDFFEVA